ncbi:GntR family transcriptional regulator [Polycladomyces abyssicola]|uniref:GntR family transcriptional regulator n=1 Tax=Polycladomyces abyssicola TaxID=1125966 RepID=A0A8D5UDX2_9BACL|nr:GntR family transcriptional regulator [Polycladomyces abyssicola]BCU81477.1 GntR family transcriptional regulator [Polycladomyces abyssicola]
MTTKMRIDSSLPNQIANLITEQIVNNQFGPGEQLREGELAEQFGTSRAPVREAFYILEVAGLVERKPRRGSFVKEYSREELIDLLELRNLMELMALERFDLRRSATPLTEMERIVTSMRELVAKRDKAAYSHLNQQFHKCIIHFAGSKLIETHYDRLITPLRVMIKLSWENNTLDRSLEDHQQIVNVLLRGDVEGAKRILDTHNRGTIHRLEKYFQSS